MPPLGSKKTVDWVQVDTMLSIQGTQVEICAILDMTEDTLNARCKEEFGITFSEYSAVKRKVGHMALRRKQFQKAMSGSDKMLIHLGEQWLGQSSKSTTSSIIHLAEFDPEVLEMAKQLKEMGKLKDE